MNLFTRLGNTILDRLAPETSAAASSPCTSGCNDYMKQTKCVGGMMYIRCCALFDNCTPWDSCGPQCA